MILYAKIMAINLYSRRTFWNSPRMYCGMKSCLVRTPSTGGLCNVHTQVGEILHRSISKHMIA
jgi:hypothetical protein